MVQEYPAKKLMQNGPQISETSGLPTKANTKLIWNKPSKTPKYTEHPKTHNTHMNKKYILAENELTIKKKYKTQQKRSYHK